MLHPGGNRTYARKCAESLAFMVHRNAAPTPGTALTNHRAVRLHWHLFTWCTGDDLAPTAALATMLVIPAGVTAAWRARKTGRRAVTAAGSLAAGPSPLLAPTAPPDTMLESEQSRALRGAHGSAVLSAVRVVHG